MDKNLSIRLYERTIEELKKQLVLLKTWLRVDKENNLNCFIKRYESLIIECSESIIKYSIKLDQLKELN